jgi:hypothetical protein
MHFKEAYETPHDPTPVMAFGTLVHDIVLGGDGFVIWPGERRAGNEWDAFKSLHEGKLIVKRDEFARAEAAALAVLSHPDAAPLLIGEREKKWEASLYGRKARGRIDVAGAKHTVELKVTNTVEPDRFRRHCLKMAWHAQVEWYRSARRAIREEPGEGFIIGVEAKAPHAVTVLRISERALVEGEKLVRLWVERLNACEASQEWPAYVSSIVELDVVEDAGIIFDGDDAEAA